MLLLWTVAAFLSGSLMFSYWLGRAVKRDLNGVGDGNPGALNLWKAAGFRLGLTGIVLDFLKGYLPLLWLSGTDYAHGYGLVPLAVAPIAGHAFSPFLRGRGGKAIAVSFGVWSAITGFEAALAYAAILAVLKTIGRMLRANGPKPAQSDGLQVVIGMALLLVYLCAAKPDPALLGVWLGNFLILVCKHRKEWASWWGKRKIEEADADN
ncbi:hypothetical protein B1A99_21385 [Cohnella sp. CIP 111063]|uniref:glycerol-3-phosphate acyltransferase n=1 Tax=unclassified Cohnella TaxID=2636738 RepID=UPI000B8C029D|nr:MULTISPECIES: glycerol-3-phosphate acyltransferase [unclassified Cohnella]OXS56316.1 hypothetical protein B1A99_21385 [Cohnella sp. CIP 111063]PRX67961.1 acyl-phosphate glycerol 3-phosphate acyltransferase [Cohnella sp. SGD-V74]